MDHENQFMKSSGEYREVCKYRESNISERRSARKLSVGACSRSRGLSATINTALQSSVQPSEREGDGGGVRAGPGPNLHGRGTSLAPYRRGSSGCSGTALPRLPVKVYLHHSPHCRSFNDMFGLAIFFMRPRIQFAFFDFITRTKIIRRSDSFDL